MLNNVVDKYVTLDKQTLVEHNDLLSTLHETINSSKNSAN